MGRVLFITLLLTSACGSEPNGFEYDGPKLTCDCDEPDKMILLYNSCLIAHGKSLHAQCFDVACKSVCPIEIDWEDLG